MAYLMVLTAIILKQKTVEKTKKTNSKSVSILICTKNDTENLLKNIPFIIEQNYPDFEIIIIDDGSTIPFFIDDSRVTIVSIPTKEKIGLGKKYALNKGIAMAKKELILLTDADCRPISKNWISEMAAGIDEDKKIVLGISPYQNKSSCLNSFIEYETAQTAIQYLGFALLGKPYMCVGRNVLYDRKLLQQKEWTSKEYAIASGDDDLTIQSLATATNTTVCLTKDSYTTSNAKETLKEYIKQKMRHYESGNLYKPSHRILLGSYLVSKLSLYFSALYLLLFSSIGLKIILGILICYFLFISILNYILNHFLDINKRWYFASINDSLYSIFTIFFGFLSLFKTTRKWK